VAFNCGVYNANSGINGNGENKGKGYFVNILFNNIFNPPPGGRMIVYANGDRTTPLRVVPIPKAYIAFAFTTGLETSRDYNVYIDVIAGGGMRQMIHKDHYYANIPSVNKMKDYEGMWLGTKDRNAFPAILGKGTSTDELFFPVTEKHVDIYGNAIPDRDDNYVMVIENEYYDRKITVINGYDAIGHKWDYAPDSSGKDFKEGDPDATQIKKFRTIYFVYGKKILKTDVNVTKTVSGDFANKTKDFTFTICFMNSAEEPMSAGTEFTYIGWAIAGLGAAVPDGGKLFLNENGAATFKLKHGQAITIQGIPVGSIVAITETKDINYDVSFSDSAGPGGQINSTGNRTISVEGRTFEFLNSRVWRPNTGIKDNPSYPAALTLIAGAILLAGWATTKQIRKKRYY
jgi:hypothetical protein